VQVDRAYKALIGKGEARVGQGQAQVQARRGQDDAYVDAMLEFGW
jgi:hypothetical protein